jgi:Na+/melibiose symporter-like transporter
MASLVGAFEMLGHTGLGSSGLVLLMITMGLVCGWLYVRHARRHKDPIIDLSLMRIPTFRAAVLAGNLCRFTVGATPFLLALLMQVGFGMSPLASGMITLASAAGALMMKFVVTSILKTWGYRRVLAVNAMLTGVSLALCASFTSTTGTLVMIGLILMAGCFRSLQFTAINSIGYADITEQKTSRASSFLAMAQQLGLSLGVGVAAGTLNLSMLLRDADNLSDVDVRFGLIVVGLVCTSASFFFLKLPTNAGASLQHPK